MRAFASLSGHVAPSDGPLVVLLGEHGSDGADTRFAVREDPDDIGAPAETRRPGTCSSGDAHRLHEVVDAPHQDPFDEGLADDRDERLLDTPERPEQPREAAALTQLRDLRGDRARPGVPAPLAVAVASGGCSAQRELFNTGSYSTLADPTG